MESEDLGIGEVARASGLPVSALRFYDGAGVLVPAWVDPATGYRRYAPRQLDEARLVAGLRRVGMPLADIRLALAGHAGGDPTLTARLLAAHVRRLELGLAAARQELSRLHTLVAPKENPMAEPRTIGGTLTLPGAELAAALDAVRFAVGSDPELPSLRGVLFDVADGVLRLVATDRFRLALAGVPATGAGDAAVPAGRALVPAPLVDAMRALLTDASRARLTLGGAEVALDVAGRVASGPTLDHEYPDYRRLVRLPAGRRVTVDQVALRAELAAGPVRAEPGAADGARHHVSVLAVTEDGGLRPVDGPAIPGQQRIGVNRDFLGEALAALATDRVEIEVGDPVAPLAIRPAAGPGAADRLTLLMPVRLDD
ncbi:MerR family transcriptional regulator [Streptomyces sp. DSM 44915]|uniref:MerR family transcriptional regulator n=1 Tax=Streptomyces chisholmiae TaxID=3075540 RepID=A0ABU2JJG2_9ACTN|nr:MerR family transcriptional regulator [Streptomyces sp. DSM 44915]MDT0265126.1 MerR family transcriptional regulator [Streptomyces sp. DSM 44915]